MPTSEEEKRDSFPDHYRWDLAEKFRERANYSANINRGLVVALSGGSIYFLVDTFHPNLGFHLVSVACFAAAIAITIWSWDVQKAKSAERLSALRDKGYKEYLELEQTYQKSFLKMNYVFDRISYAFLAVGALIEFVPMICRSVR